MQLGAGLQLDSCWYDVVIFPLDLAIFPLDARGHSQCQSRVEKSSGMSSGMSPLDIAAYSCATPR